MIPKFRAWDKKHKQMVRVISLNWYEEITDYNVVGLFPNTESVARFWDETIVMQCTGLRDINGVEIYEGDIVHIYDEEEYRTIDELDNVVIRGGCFTTERYGYDFYNCEGDYLEVVGNIYENPERLEAHT